jgi:hypothetical protein
MSVQISGIGSSAGTSPLAGLYQQRRKDFQSLESAVQSGDASGAKQALAAFQKDSSTIQSSQGGQAASLSPSSSSPVGQDLASLTQAVQSGDIGTAQKALAQLQGDAKAHGHGHHHHHADADASSSATTPTSSTPTTPSGLSSLLATATQAYAAALGTSASQQASSFAAQA